MRRDPTRVTDGLGRTVATGSFIGAGLGTTTLVVVFAGALSSFSFGGCNLGFSTPSAPVRDGLGIAVASDGSEVATVDSSSGFLDVIDQGRLTEQVPVGGQTTDVAFTPNGRTVVVTDTDVGGSAGSLAVVDLATATVTARVLVGSGPTGVAVSPDGRLAYVADTGYLGAGTVDVVDLATDRVTTSIAVGSQPTGLVLSTDGNRLYVVDANLVSSSGFIGRNSVDSPQRAQAGAVEIVDTHSLIVTGTATVGMAPLFASLSPDGSTLAVGDYGSNALSLVDTVSLQTRTVAVPHGAFGVAYAPDGRRIFVCGGYSPLLEAAQGSDDIAHVTSNTVSVVDVASETVSRSVPVPHNPTAVATTATGTIYVALGDFPAVARIDPSTLAVAEVGVPALAPPRSGTSKP